MYKLQQISQTVFTSFTVPKLCVTTNVATTAMSMTEFADEAPHLDVHRYIHWRVKKPAHFLSTSTNEPLPMKRKTTQGKGKKENVVECTKTCVKMKTSLMQVTRELDVIYTL